MNIHLPATATHFLVDRFDGKETAAALQVHDIARQRRLPRAITDSLAEHLIENQRTGRRQGNAALVTLCPNAGEHGAREFQVSSVVAESLLAEIVGHTGFGNCRQTIIDCRFIPAVTPDTNPEPIGCVTAPLQFPVMACMLADARFGKVELAPVDRRFRQIWNAEPLQRNSMPVFHSRVADITYGYAGVPGQGPGNPDRIGAGLFYEEQFVRTLPGRRKSQYLVDSKVFGNLLDPAFENGWTMRTLPGRQ